MNKFDTIPEISTIDELRLLQENHASFLAVVFYSDTSEKSKDALSILAEIGKQKPETAICSVNVSRVRSIHQEFNVTSVPLIITMKNGIPAKRIEGLQSRATYEMLLGEAPRKRPDGTEAPPLRVTVYSSPTCPPCGVVKAYLRKKSVPFRVVDITRDEHAAQEIMNRTGSTAVPQTDINGTVVIGADMAGLDELLRM